MTEPTVTVPVDQCPETDPETGVRCIERVGRHHCGPATHSYKLPPLPGGTVLRRYWKT